MRRLALMATIVISSGGCTALDPPEVKRCEEQLLAKLKAPSTYKRINLSVTDINPARPDDLRHFTERWVSIEYDAVNSFNAPIRDTERCRYPLKNGKADEWNAIDDSLLPVENIDAGQTVKTPIDPPAPQHANPEAQPADDLDEPVADEPLNTAGNSAD